VKEKTVVIAPSSVAAQAPAGLKKSITTLVNGKSVEKACIKVEAVPMYKSDTDTVAVPPQGA